jgi:hypothetical protein
MNRNQLVSPIVLGIATAAALATPAAAREPIDDITAERCHALDSRQLEIELKPSGQVKLVYGGDDVATCNEAMVVTSYASAGPAVDNHVDPVLDQIVFFVTDLEAAGPAGVTVAPALDPCWAGLQVHRDGDTLVWEHVDGDGCEMHIATDFAGAAWDTEIHVVQQTGNIQPPHVFEHDADETTVLSGLPDGTWYVKVYEGAVAGTTMSVGGGAASPTNIVHAVPDGAAVEITHPLAWRSASLTAHTPG